MYLYFTWAFGVCDTIYFYFLHFRWKTCTFSRYILNRDSYFSDDDQTKLPSFSNLNTSVHAATHTILWATLLLSSIRNSNYKKKIKSTKIKSDFCRRVRLINTTTAFTLNKRPSLLALYSVCEQLEVFFPNLTCCHINEFQLTAAWFLSCFLLMLQE